MGRHYLDLADARTLPTPGLVATHRAVADLLVAAEHLRAVLGAPRCPRPPPGITRRCSSPVRLRIRHLPEDQVVGAW